MSRAEKIIRIREIMNELAEHWSYIDGYVENNEGDNYIENTYYWIQTLEHEKLELERELQ